jgi:hypothetical protein
MTDKATDSAAPAKTDPTPAIDPESKLGVFMLGMYVIVLTVFAIYEIVVLWPSSADAGTTGISVVPFLPSFALSVDSRYLLLAVACGLLGSVIQLGSNFALNLGWKQLSSTWNWWYVLLPFNGSALALVFYFAARGGLLKSDQPASDLNPFAIAAFAALTGMFSERATAALQKFFSSQVPGGDQ